MIWAAISWNSLGLALVLHGRVNSQTYLSILSDQVYPIVQTLFANGSAMHQSTPLKLIKIGMKNMKVKSNTWTGPHIAASNYQAS